MPIPPYIQQAHKNLLDILNNHTITKADLAQSFKWFDNILFKGDLQKYQCVVEYQPPEHLDPDGNIAQCIFPKPSDSYDSRIIVAHPHPDCNGARAIFGALLHEMVHAYLFTSMYQASTIYQDGRSAEIGEAGHGRPWQEEALEIERDAESWLAETWNLGRDRGFAFEWATTHPTPDSLPSQSELDEWGFDLSTIAPLIRHFRSEKVSRGTNDSGVILRAVFAINGMEMRKAKGLLVSLKFD
jgi:hypothetical protein